MKKNQMCKTYLIAYSSEDFEVFPMRKSCSLSIAEAFDWGTSKVKVAYWASVLENHQMAGSTIM